MTTRRLLAAFMAAFFLASCAGNAPSRSVPTAFVPAPGDRTPEVDPANLVVNPDFFSGTAGWSGLWTREPGKGRVLVVRRGPEGYVSSLWVEHAGEKDWSFQQEKELPVVPGEIYRYAGWLAVQGGGRAEFSVILYDQARRVMDWSFARSEARMTDDFARVERKLLVPAGAAFMRFRLTGYGPAEVYCTGMRLEKVSAAAGEQATNFTIGNKRITARLDGRDGSLTVAPTTGGLSFTIEDFIRGVRPGSLTIGSWTQVSWAVFNALGPDARASLSLTGQGEAVFSLVGEGGMEVEVPFPGTWRALPGSLWVIPENEGLLIPADDPHYHIPWGKTFYSGHGFCMPFLGLTDGSSGVTVIVETPDDAGARFERPDQGRPSAFRTAWQPSRGQWSYERRLRVRFVSGHGYVGVAKAYRSYARETGKLVTLKEKSKTAPEAARLPGCVDLWFWKNGSTWTPENDPRDVAREMYTAGIRRVLWSSETGRDAIEFMNGLGFITGRYDIYQDVYPPDSPAEWMIQLNREAWPDALILDRYGERMSGWVHRQNGREYPAGVICPQPGLELLKAHVEADLRDKPYRARFIDTTTASPLRECYSPAHPLSRSGNREYKSRQLAYLTENRGLVTGSETGIDWAVPYLHYFEGMTSLGDYRLPDSGYDLWSVRPPTDGFLRFQVGPYYRIPLFELVYHDCVASFPYWGDASNRLDDWWETRDLFSTLYGTGPLWIVDRARWKKDRDKFVQSYRRATETARRTGLSEMLEHRFLSDDHTIQYTRFADGTRVWVNFGEKDAVLPDGRRIAPKRTIIE